MAKAKEAFVPHKNAPGPPRLEMPVADFSGTVNTDPQFIADRLAIQNHVMAYSYLIDEGRRWMPRTSQLPLTSTP